MAILVLTYDTSTGGFRTQLIGSAQVSDGAIISAKIAAGAIGTPHIQSGILLDFPSINTSGEPGFLLGGGACLLTTIVGVNTLGELLITGPTGSGQCVASGSIPNLPATKITEGVFLSARIGSGIIGIPHLQPWASGKLLVGQGTTTTPIAKDQQAAIGFIIDGAGAAITSGEKGHLEVPFPCTLNSVRLLGDQSGQIDVHIWKDTYSNFPPTSGDTICSNFLPRISGSFKYQETSLSGWARSILSGDILAFTVNPVASNIQRCTVSLGVYK